MFIEPNLEVVLPILEKLEPDTPPLWGSMSAQRMVEHLTDTMRIANGKNPMGLVIPEEKATSYRRFLDSDKPMARNIEVVFASNDIPLRNEELELAIDEFTDEWLDFEEYFASGDKRSVHPYYGELNYDQWMSLHSKHLTHHFTQFGLL